MKSSEFPAFTRELASRYLKASFDPTDRLAVVLVNKSADSVIQRIATAETIASTDFQAWLRYHNNAEHYEIYVSMNALHPAAKGRTKADVAVIRHVYLDFDKTAPLVFRRSLSARTSRCPVMWSTPLRTSGR